MDNLGQKPCDVKPLGRKGDSMIKTVDLPPGPSEWMNVHEAAEYLRLPVTSVRRLTRSGEIPSRRFTPRNTRYSRTALDKWALDQERG